MHQTTFFLSMHKTCQPAPIIGNWFYCFSLDTTFCLHLRYNFCARPTSTAIKKAKGKGNKKHLKELFSIVSLLHPLLLDVQVNDGSPLLLAVKHMTSCRNKTDMWVTLSYTCSRCFDNDSTQHRPRHGILGSLQLQQPLAECRWDLNYTLLHRSSLGDFLLQILLQVDFKMFAKLLKNASR